MLNYVRVLKTLPLRGPIMYYYCPRLDIYVLYCPIVSPDLYPIAPLRAQTHVL